jgi:outer membrane cobalamin receptor
MHLDAVDLDTGEELLNRPRTSAHLVATAWPGRTELSFVASYVGPRINAYPEFPYGPTPVGGYATFDVAAGMTLAHALHPYVRVTNVLDRATQPVLGFPAPGRTFVGGVRTAW